jgi:two-component system, response regulator FlrC
MKPTSLVSGKKPPVPVAESAAMREVLSAIEDVTVGSTTVLLIGESGTGKEVVARHIHASSPRAAGPWVAVNCAALPAELLESELFGHERGAFTGASERRIGKIEQANGGTLLLDEISEMPLPLQAKLLRVLQEREVDRVGGTKPVGVDVRVIATTNRDLAQMVAEKLFRGDLFFRLNVFPIELPALRERRQDLPLLCTELLQAIGARLDREPPRLEEAAMAVLAAYDFPGNVRELGNVLERAALRCRSGVLAAAQIDAALRAGRGAATAGALEESGAPLPASNGAAATSATPPAAAPGERAPNRFPEDLPIGLATLERLAIDEALRRVGGNRTHAARLLGISIRTLRNKLRELRDAGAAELAGRQELPSRRGGRNSENAWGQGVARASQGEAA